MTRAGGAPRRAVRRRVVVEPGLAYETCDPAPTSEATRRALDDIARAAARLLGGAQDASVVAAGSSSTRRTGVVRAPEPGRPPSRGAPGAHASSITQ